MTTLYRLSNAARTDLADIYRHTRENFGLPQAETYAASLKGSLDLIGAQPLIGTERPEVSPPVRLHPHGQHHILYVVNEGRPLILRILSGRQNWQQHLVTQ